MPELPEVEAARRLLQDALVGRRLSAVEFAPDDIVLGKRDPGELSLRYEGQVVSGTGRRGKYFWLEFGPNLSLLMHLGMNGAILDRTPGQERSVNYMRESHVPVPGERPKYLKLWIETEDGNQIAFTDSRRLARIWLGEAAQNDPRVAALGPDAYAELPELNALAALVQRRKAPVKAVLLDQSFLAGIGNYLADEVLYQSGIAPARLGASLTLDEVERLRAALVEVLSLAVSVGADYEQFPPTWIFHARWGGKRGQDVIGGEEIVRETIGGRTTAWVPSRQN